MQKLKIDLGSCVRVSSKFSECSKCHDICPIDLKGISFNENIPLINDSCIDCGGCIGICPSEAISLKDFDSINFLFDFLKSDETLISCKSNIPCLAVLSVENLISLAILGESKTLLDLGHCNECQIGELKSQIEANIKETNRFLSTLGTSYQIKNKEVAFENENLQEEKDTPNRREFLKRFSPKGVILSKVEFDKELQEADLRGSVDLQDSAKKRQKPYPNKRKLFFMALKRLDESDFEPSVIDADELSFISNKSIDESCDNCSICYRVCPTNALSSDKRGSQINFDALSCLKCHLCHDVCEKDSIKIVDFDSTEFFHSHEKTLIKFRQRRCEECGVFFSIFDDSLLCPRCKIEEEEAKSLWGIQ